ncbi:uncharacterized protein BX663DRAFT_494339 [Cokeromyces recurvatus]|uniref:uncharacterized protein n=1 Tax=Cokeromyces recurvatus TaxID=90255 RepID=UPI002220A7F5|nr:uncharacterized protein BX663DRAFT_494339 [Cokeromyces recurvatus]KAI7906960.1 hypothetical protein BX663DRAFT_494339 [Cokeromyces recurvatus]
MKCSTLVAYEDSVISSFELTEEKYSMEKRIVGIVSSLNLEPFGIYNENDGEMSALTSKNNIDILIEKYHGEKVFISRKRRDIEEKKVMRQFSNDNGFSSRILNGPYAKTLSKRHYFELTKNICTLLNTCWLSSPNMKYFAAKVMAGAILYNFETGQTLLITSLEMYGRTPSVDPHFENPQVSFPPSDIKYQNMWPMTNKTNEGTKLIIRTMEFNYLITASIRVDSIHLPEVRPSTKSFLLNSVESSKNTQIFLDRNVYEEAKLLGENLECSRIEISHSLYQVRQIRSKLTEIETYDKLRATFDILNIVTDQPVTIFTLCDFPKAIPSDDGEPYYNYTLGSKLFMKIATERFNKKYKAQLEKDIIESIMLKFKDKSKKIPQIIEEILDIYNVTGVEKIRILYNQELNRVLVKLTNVLAPSITKANKEIVKNIKIALKQH